MTKLRPGDEGYRSKRERLDRLRERLGQASTWPQLRGVLKGLLDLLDEEL